MKYTRSVPRPYPSFLRIIIIVFFVGLLPAGGVFAQEKHSSFAEMIRKEKVAIEITQRDLRTYIAAQPERMGKISEKSQELSQEMLRLSIMYNMEEGNPVEMRDILRQMKIAHDQCVTLAAPVNADLEAIEGLKKVLRTHLGEYERLAADKSSPEVSEAAAGHVMDMKETIALVERAQGIIDIIPNAIEHLLARLEPRKVIIENDLTIAWKKYFLAPQFSPSLFTADAWKSARVVLNNWAGFGA